MNKKLIFRILIVLGFLLLVYETLSVNFDDLSGSLTRSKIIGLLIPILVIFSSWFYLRDMKKASK